MKNNGKIEPSKATRWLFRKIFPDGGYDTTVCDLEESYREVVKERGLFFAKTWYWFQVLAALYFFICLQIRGSLSMFKHHLKISIRNLRRHKGYSFINIFGLAVSFTVVIYIALFIQNELSFDRENEHLDRMYTIMMGGDKGQQYIISAAALELSENIPEIVKYTRLGLQSDSALQYRESETEHEKNIMIKDMTYAWVDPGMFEVFTYDFKAGNPETVLNQPFSIVLTEEVAKNLFGGKDPIGKVVTLNSRYEMTVTGVVTKPAHSHLDLNVFASILTLRSIRGPDADRNYEYNSYPTYVLLPEEHDLEEVNRKIDAHMASVFERAGRPKDEFSLFPVSDIYLSDIHFQGNHGNRTLLWILFTIAVFIVTIAGINFVNLSTARASTRAREIGIKKVLGANRPQLITQFLSESIVTAYIALILAILLMLLLLTPFNNFAGKHFTADIFLRPSNMIFILALGIILGISSGLYPAFFLSASQTG